MRDVSAPIQFDTKETKHRKLPTQICVLSSTTRGETEGLIPDVAGGRRRGGGGGGGGGGRAKLGDVYSTTWRAL